MSNKSNLDTADWVSTCRLWRSGPRHRHYPGAGDYHGPYRVFPFDSTKEAMAYVETGRAKGKVVIKVR